MKRWIAVRFKHRIVSIHCFPNGNGRHSRLMADIIIEKVFNKPVFNWGAGRVTTKGGSLRYFVQRPGGPIANDGSVQKLLEEMIEAVDVEDVAGLDEFGGYFFVGAAGFGVAGWVVVDDHDGVCVGEEGAFIDFAGVDE